jgi:4-deoxy-L-threo-5-hexosulose-uronate ketol-isomerase
MEVRYAGSPADAKAYATERIRREYLIQRVFSPGISRFVYSHSDRMVIGGICPVEPALLPAGEELKASFFLQRREMGVINVGPQGSVTVDGKEHVLKTRDGLYMGMGSREVVFASGDPRNPARFYLLSAPAHSPYPTVKIEPGGIEPTRLGSPRESNVRALYKYIHPAGVKSCQLVMGMTLLEENNVWNSMPSHTHDRRMEVYFYFDLANGAVVFHFMGEPGETRHLVVRNEEAVISPSWSIHSGVGTTRYAFIWGMAGENQEFSDMDGVSMAELG